MTSKRIAQTNKQQKSEKAQGSGILQRATVRSVTDAGAQFEEQEALALTNSGSSKDFSQVLISTHQSQQFHAKKPQNYRLPPIQAKLTIGEPDDRYEQEADRVASEVVQRINAPSSTGESVQREAKPENEEELQMKSLANSIQRAEIDDEEELQMKTQVQRREAIGGGEALTDLESSINSARGGGQTISDNIREPMEVAFGADFSGVKVHTDGQSDQLNRSIQARAFTTGQDVFFRQGEYNPGSRGGQELIAHELTHVVQQNGGAVQRSQEEAKGKAHQARTTKGSETNYCHCERETIQRMLGEGVMGFEGQKKPTGYGSVLLKATLNGVDLGDAWSKKYSFGSGTEHAEDALVDTIQKIMMINDFPALSKDATQVEQQLANQIANGQRNLVINGLTASPCGDVEGTNKKGDMSGCTERLIKLATKGKFKITVNADHYYQPQGVPDAKKQSMAACQRMINAGITVNIANP